MWSLGCVIAELFLGWPLYPGASEYDQVTHGDLWTADECIFGVCVCVLSSWVWTGMCLGGWDASPWNPPDSPRWFSHSVPVYLNRCRGATCPISAAPVLQSKTLSRSSLTIIQMRHSGETLSKLCYISISNKLFWYTSTPKSKNWTCFVYKSQISFGLLSWGHVCLLFNIRTS